MKQKREKYINIAVCAIAFLFILFLTAITPYLSDEWHFKFIWKNFGTTDNDELLQSIGGIFESAKNYYKLSGGRVLCHFVLFIFNCADKWIFNIVNSLIFVLLLLLLYGLIKRGRNKSTPWLLPLIFLYIFVFCKDFGDVMLWEAGAVDYLWPAALLLLAAKLADTDIEKMPARKYVFTCIIVFLSSMTNEVTGGMLAILIFLTLIERKSKFSARYILLFALIAAGIAIVIASPGNYIRLGIYDNTKMPLLLSLRIYYKYYFDYSLPNIYIGIFSIVYFYGEKKNIISSIVQHKYFAAGTAGMLVMFAVRLIYLRPLLFGWLFLTIGSGTSLYRLKDDISEKISSKQPGIVIKLLKTFFLANLIMYAFILLKYIKNPANIIVYAMLTALIEFLIFVAIALIKISENSAEGSKERLERAAEKIRAVFSKAAKFLPSVVLSLICMTLTADIVYQTYLYIGDIKAFNNYMEEVYICAEEQNGLDSVEHLMYGDNWLITTMVHKKIFGKTSRFIPGTIGADTCNNYVFSWLYKYCAYTGYTGRGY